LGELRPKLAKDYSAATSFLPAAECPLAHAYDGRQTHLPRGGKVQWGHPVQVFAVNVGVGSQEAVQHCYLRFTLQLLCVHT